MPIAMSNYANRQSPNQQAKIASMLAAADQSQRPDQDTLPSPNIMGSMADPYMVAPMRPPPIMDQSGRPDQFGGLRTYDNPPPMRSPRQDIGPAPEFEKRPYTGPGPTPAPPISQSLGRMQQQPPTIRDQGLRPDPSAPQDKDDSPRPEANRRYKLAASSPSAGTQYGEDIAGRPAPQSVHRVANRSVGSVGSPGGWFGTDFMKGVGYTPPQDTHITLDPSEQYALQQNGYIDLNGLRYAKNDYGEIVNIGSTPGRDTGGLGYIRPMGPGEF